MTVRLSIYAAIAAATLLSGGAFAQTTTTTTTITDEQTGIVRTYVTRQQRQSVTSPQQYGPGATVPSSYELYTLPADLGVNYSYSVINNRTVIIDPVTRRVIQVID
jgi:carbohydrate-binding DOMON domain-containing protein